MEISKKCPHCDTVLEFEDGSRHVMFTAHDDAFCHLATRDRVRLLEQALVTQRETYEHHIDRFKRRVDEMLTKHGLPTLTELDERARRDAELLRLRFIDPALGEAWPALEG